MSLEDLVTDADDKLLNLILYSQHHVLHSILPGRSDCNYNLRPRRHNLVPAAKKPINNRQILHYQNDIQRYLLIY